MHFALIFCAIIITASHAHPAGGKCNEPTTTERARPIQQFFKNVLSALRPTTTKAPARNKTDWISVASSLHAQQLQAQKIPNYVDFSSYLLNSLANNTAIKFSFMQPNETFAPTLRGNYSVISFFVPQDEEIVKNNGTKGIFGFLSNLRLPWSRPNRVPSNTEVSKFPPILEYFTQRIQAYFSIYKYTDDSRVNNTIVVFAPGPEDFPETSVRIVNDEVVDTTEMGETNETTETTESFDITTETTERFEDTTETTESYDETTETTEKEDETSELNRNDTENTDGLKLNKSFDNAEGLKTDFNSFTPDSFVTHVGFDMVQNEV